MQGDRDHYEAYYADKLWNLLPALYRTEDTDAYDRNGPLREMVNRIGAQAAILRRSMDRMWEDHSIETCDDWIIFYIADLLATRMVASLEPREQRLNVAKTIYYRRRKGTVALLEELAVDITGWEARVVEFFRRLGRTRHGLDPEIGWPADARDEQAERDARRLQRAEGLVGPLTTTEIGGWADLRSVYGASETGSAFDEYFHTADLRRGRGRIGWHNIPRLGVFLWRLRSFQVEQTTPVPVENCPGYYTFDPTGREIALFAHPARPAGGAYGENWVSPQEWQLPTPISKPLLETALEYLRETPPQPGVMPMWAVTGLQSGQSDLHALGVFRKPGNDYVAIEGKLVSTDPQKIAAKPQVYAVHVDPERGRFRILQPPASDVVFGTYHYGFSSLIGAGPYDRRRRSEKPVPPANVRGGGDNLDIAMGAVFTRVIGDSLTYTKVRAVTGVQDFALRASDRQRPVIRLPAPAPNPTEWAFAGLENSRLLLDGLFISGGNIVLQGKFDRVTVQCCTLDPGSRGAASFVKAVDGRDLIPCKLIVEGQVGELIVDRCIVGPILTHNRGEIETLRINDSTLQAFAPDQTIVVTTGEAILNRCTLLGPASLERLYASDCILDDVVTVADAQHGCVRFSAWATGSLLPGPYESVEVAAGAPLFHSRLFGEAEYAQLREGVDASILSGAKGATIAAGAEDGSEMGAFSREKNPIKERSLLIKYEEFMPVGLVPVVIYAT